MKKIFLIHLCLLGFFLTIFAQEKTSTEKLQIDGLKAPVEIIIDHWGFEIWRRQSTGTVAEILGERELKRDIGTRLFQFRGDIKAEMNHYHDRGELIITSYVAGVNKYIELTEKNPKLLPVEFGLLGIKPQKWTPEVVISRHQGLLGNIGDELKIGRQVAMMGVEKTKELNWFHPNDPILELETCSFPTRRFDIRC